MSPTGLCSFAVFEKFTRASLHQTTLEIVLQSIQKLAITISVNDIIGKVHIFTFATITD